MHNSGHRSGRFCYRPPMRKGLIGSLLILALNAQAEQKNVQLLTGLSDPDLFRVMNFMRASLGVHCDFCHVVNKDTGWDFPNDAKTTKRTARRMIQMVEQINQQNFENDRKVSCNTCHRGSTQPVSLPVLPQVPPPFPTPVRTPPTGLPTRDEIVAKYAAALGDASRLKLPRIVKGTREGSDGKSATFEAQIAGEKMHVNGQTPFGLTEQVFIGSAGWIKTDKGVRQMKADDLETFRTLAGAYEPVLPEAIPADAQVVNVEKIGDHDTVIVVARIDDHTRQRLYFDRTTGLLVRRLVLYRVPIAEVPQQTDFDDYRDVNGTKYPFLVRVSLVDPWNSATRHYTEVQLGATIDEKSFNPLTGSPPLS
jgi:photosynthetic reaction center cytochrome c subunit